MNQRTLRRPSVAITLSLLLPAAAGAQGFTKHADLTYGVAPTFQGSQSLELDLYIPNGATSPLPLVIWVHGGGWSGGTKDNPGGLFLINEGFALASVEYRLSGAASWPAQIQDVKGAVRWLRANAAAYGLDPNRFGAYGSSAGGHLVAFLGTAGHVGDVELGGIAFDLEGDVGGNLDQSSRVQAVADFFGPTDFSWMGAFPSAINHDAASSPESNLLGLAIAEAPMAVTSADPATWLSRDDPPLHIQHGTADPAVPFSQSERFFREATHAVGIDADFSPVLDGGHGGPGFDNATVRAFFNEHLGAVKGTAVSVTRVGGATSESGPPAAAFRLTRSGSLQGDCVVSLRVAGTAREGDDFEPLGTVAVIPDGVASIDLYPQPIDDAWIEGTESIDLFVCPSADYAVLAGGERARIDLTDDDAPGGAPVVTIVASDATASEASMDPGAFVVARTGATGAPLLVRLCVSGRALPGADYLPIAPIVTIPAGSTTAAVPVLALDDPDVETVETVVLSIEPGPAYAIGSERAAHVRLLDDDSSGLPVVCVAVERAQLSETDGLSDAFLITRTGSPFGTLHVSFSLSGEATPGSDFAPTGTTVTFGLGETSKRVRLDPSDDAEVEGDETVILTIAPGAGYVRGPQRSVSLRLTDSDSDVPAAAPARLVVSPIERGVPMTATVRGPAPGKPYLLLLSANAAYAPAAGYPLLVDPATMLPLLSGVLGADGLDTVVLPTPSNLPDTLIAPLLFQAATLDASGVVRLSNREDRRFREARP